MSDLRKKSNAIVLLSIIAFVLIYFLFIFRLIPNYALLISSIFIVGLTITSYFVYGFQHCGLNKIRKQVILEVLISVIGYFILIYMLGLIVGFSKNSYSLNFVSILKNTLIPLIFVSALEIFRYIFISANRDSKELISYLTMTLILLEIAFNFYQLESSLAAIFIFITVKIIPIIFKNIVMSYLSYQVGYHSCLVYVIPMSIYIYIFPHIPSLGNYLYSILGVTLPSVIYIITSKMVSKNLSEKKGISEKIKTIILIPIVLFLLLIICLTSFKFKYSLIGVNTDAIEGLDEGDLILVNKIDYKDYKLGDIIVYRNNDKIVLDVITRINKFVYITSGYDENDNNIYKAIDEQSLLGKYNDFRIPRLGYPTIWFNDLIQGDIHED